MKALLRLRLGVALRRAERRLGRLDPTVDYHTRVLLEVVTHNGRAIYGGISEDMLRTIDRFYVRDSTPGGGKHVSSSARRVMGWAMRIIPVMDRDRYAEEFESELLELAQGPRPHLRQLGYTVRVSVRAVSLRRALRRPAAERVR
jgi:hypothetical protein